MEDSGAKETRTDSLISELVKDESTEFALPDESTSQVTQARESTPSDWTDEKHNLFLESMETSFVSELYRSMHSVGSCPVSQSKSKPQFSQFKVLRHGSWNNMKFDSTEARMKILNESQALSRNPWIHRFRAARKDKNAACKSQAMNSGGRNSLTSGSSHNSRPTNDCDSHLLEQYSDTEVSDQNFVDEDSEAKKKSVICNGKRIKTSETNTLSNDQVVP